MTELLLKVDHAAKAVKAVGRIAAGEDVELTVDFGAPVEDIDQVRVRFRHLGTDVAVFPWLGLGWSEKTPGAGDGVYVGILDTGTEELAEIFADLPDRATHIFDVIVDQVPNEDDVDETYVMYGIGKIRIQKWSADLTLTDITEGPRPVTLLAALEGKIGKDELATALAGLADLAANSTQKDIRTKANEIIAILRGLATAAVAFFLGFSAFALPWEEVPPDTTVNTAIVGAEVGDGLALRSGVLSARGGISTNNVNDLIADATNAIPRGIDGTAATNIVQGVVTKGYVEDLGIDTGPDGAVVTNIAEGVVQAATNALPPIVPWDPEGHVLDIGDIGGIVFGDTPTGLLIDDRGRLVFNDNDHDASRFVGHDDLEAVDVRINLPPLSESSTVGDLVDAFNAIADALRKEEEEP